MAKYIDAEKLIVEIERYIKHYESSNRDDFRNGELYICQELLSFIDSLQQEQPDADFAKEIENYYYDNFAFISSAHTPTKDIVSDIATHFYELGQQKTKEESK